MPIPYRLGVDVGTNSLGWCVLDLDKEGRPEAIRRMGVRIFSDGRDPQSGTSLAVDRRDARSARRRRDRFVDRRTKLMKTLTRHGLMPADPVERKNLETLDPYELRARGLDEKLHPHHLGRAVFHLNQRRGFKSNRKTDKAQNDGELKGMKGGISKLQEAMDETGARTLGEYLYTRFRKGRTVRGAKDGSVKSHGTIRARPQVVRGKNEYDHYADRAMYEQEFDVLWQRQLELGAVLTGKAREEIRDILFYQRRLRPVDPGPCTFEPNDRRAPLALPIVQDFRILQELANLEITDLYGQNARRLTRAERDKLYAILKRKEKFPFRGRTSIQRELGLSSDSQFNLEDERRKDLKGDPVSAALSRTDCFGERWFEFSEPQQTSIIRCLIDEPETAVVVGKAQSEWGVTRDAAEKVAIARLPDGYGRLGLTALRKIVGQLRDGVGKDGGPMRYDEAVAAADPRYHHSDFRDGEILERLPYYGSVLTRYVAPVTSEGASEDERKHGRIANPTVHIALNQIRRLVNALIERYGEPPSEIVVELARDLKLSKEEKDRIRSEQTENQKKNELRRAKLKEIGEAGRSDGILRLKLWEELNPDNPLDRRCVYTGEPISISRLFSEGVEIEHILPFKQSLDDSPANLTVSMRYANRDKGNQTPWEAFHGNPKYEWDDVLLRVATLPKNKQWRFREDAMQVVQDRAQRALLRERNELPKDVLDDIERTGGFLARQLVDTAYLARVTRQYLWKVCHPDAVRVVPGRLTALLRRKWSLNRLLYGNRPAPEDDDGTSFSHPKRRNDHRHHAIDAFVVALTDFRMLHQVSSAADQYRDRLFDDMPKPWPGFDLELKTNLDRLTISYKPDHARQGKLHEETAYGIIRCPEKEAGATLVYRKNLKDLNANEIDRIRDSRLRADVKRHVGHLLFDQAKLDSAQESLKEARRRKDAIATAAAKDDVERLKQDRKNARKVAAKDLQAALIEFSAKNNIRRVRLVKNESGYIQIRDRSGHPYKALTPGQNYCVDILAAGDGSWRGQGIPLFTANQPSYSRERIATRPDAVPVMRVHKGDLLKLEHNGTERIFRVVKLVPSNGLLWLSEHAEAGNLQQRNDDKEDAFNWLYIAFSQMKARNARKVTVDFLGRVHDPGPPK